MYAAAHQLTLEFGRLAHELMVFVIGAKIYHPLDAGAVVPGTIEQHDLAGGWQVPNITLKVPLAAFDLAGFFERNDARTTGVQVLHHALDGAALAGRVAPFEQDDDTLAGLLDPGLQLEQFDLQAVFLIFVTLARQQVLVRIGAAVPLCRSRASASSAAIWVSSLPFRPLRSSFRTASMSSGELPFSRVLSADALSLALSTMSCTAAFMAPWAASVACRTTTRLICLGWVTPMVSPDAALRGRGDAPTVVRRFVVVRARFSVVMCIFVRNADNHSARLTAENR
jgi:hypothetical protein